MKRKPVKLQVNNVIASFPWLFSFNPDNEDDNGQVIKDYSINLICCQKRHRAFFKALNAEVEEVAKGYDKWGGKVPKGLKVICCKTPESHPDYFYDEDTEELKDGYFDSCFVVQCKNNRRVPVVDRDPTIPVVEEDEKLYGGSIINAAVSLYPWENKKQGKGVSANILSVQCVDWSTEPLGGGIKFDAATEFSNLEGYEEEEDDGIS